MVAYFLHPETKPFALRVPPLSDLISSAWVLSHFSWTVGTTGEASTTNAGGGVAAFAWLHRMELFKIFFYSIVWLAGVFSSPLALNLVRILPNLARRCADADATAAPQLRSGPRLDALLALLIRLWHFCWTLHLIHRLPERAVPRLAAWDRDPGRPRGRRLQQSSPDEGGRRRGQLGQRERSDGREGDGESWIRHRRSGQQ